MGRPAVLFYDGVSKECGKCHEVLPLSNFGIAPPKFIKNPEKCGSSKYRGMCKPCLSKVTCQQRLVRKAMSTPWRVKKCNKCELLFHACHAGCIHCKDEGWRAKPLVRKDA